VVAAVPQAGSAAACWVSYGLIGVLHRLAEATAKVFVTGHGHPLWVGLWQQSASAAAGGSAASVGV
jgi:hypothetical protein